MTPNGQIKSIECPVARMDQIQDEWGVEEEEEKDPLTEDKISEELNESRQLRIRLFLMLAPGGAMFVGALGAMGLTPPGYDPYLAIGGFLMTLVGIHVGGKMVRRYDDHYRRRRGFEQHP